MCCIWVGLIEGTALPPGMLRRTNSSPVTSARNQLSPPEEESLLAYSPASTISPSLTSVNLFPANQMDNSPALSETRRTSPEMNRTSPVHPSVLRSRSDSSALRSQPSLTCIPESTSSPPRVPPRSLARQMSFASSKSSSDAFQPTTTPSTIYTSSTTSESSRPSSYHLWSISDNDHRQSTASSLTSPSLSSLIDAELHEQLETLDESANKNHANLVISAALSSATTSANDPISPSKVGLGISSLESQQGQPTAGRHKSILPTGTRSRSSSVAERVERARLSSFNDWNAAGEHEAVKEKRAIGLAAVLDEETTHWSLRDCPDSNGVMRVLQSVAVFTSLRVLDIS